MDRPPLRRRQILLSFSFCIAGATSAGELPRATIPDEATISDLAQQMQRRELTSRALVQHYLDRIAALDKSGPAINAMIELNPDALAIADRLDAERKHGKLRGPLHGIPVLIKDNIDTADAMHTSAGSLALAESIAGRDATVAAKLRGAGAVILGKTNLSRMGQLPFRTFDERLERTRRPDEESLRTRPQPVRVELGHRRGDRGQSRRRRRRHGDRRLDCLPLVGQWPCRHQTDDRAREPRGYRADIAQPGHRRPDGAQRARCRAIAQCSHR